MDLILLKITTVLYVLAAFGYLGHLLAPGLRSERMGVVLLVAGGVFHLATILDRWVELGISPVTGFRESLSLFAFSLTLVYLALQSRTSRPVIGAFVTPLVVVAMITVLMVPDAGGQIPPTLRSRWLPVHISMAFLGDAAFAVAAAVAALYLILDSKMKRKSFGGGLFSRLPSLETLDNLNYNLVRFGFVLLSLAIITGTLWAGRAWESYFDWEPRQTSAMVVWALYAALIVSRWIVGWRGRKAALITLVGFVMMIGSFVTLKVFDIGRHLGTYT